MGFGFPQLISFQQLAKRVKHKENMLLKVHFPELDYM